MAPTGRAQVAAKRTRATYLNRSAGQTASKERDNRVLIFLRRILIPMRRFFVGVFFHSSSPGLQSILRGAPSLKVIFKSGLYLHVGNHPLAVL